MHPLRSALLKKSSILKAQQNSHKPKSALTKKRIYQEMRRTRKISNTSQLTGASAYYQRSTSRKNEGPRQLGNASTQKRNQSKKLINQKVQINLEMNTDQCSFHHVNTNCVNKSSLSVKVKFAQFWYNAPLSDVTSWTERQTLHFQTELNYCFKKTWRVFNVSEMMQV